MFVPGLAQKSVPSGGRMSKVVFKGNTKPELSQSYRILQRSSKDLHSPIEEKVLQRCVFLVLCALECFSLLLSQNFSRKYPRWPTLSLW